MKPVGLLTSICFDMENQNDKELQIYKNQEGGYTEQKKYPPTHTHTKTHTHTHMHTHTYIEWGEKNTF